MIIRKCTTKTLKASSLDNRGCEVPPGAGITHLSTLEECPCCLMGDPFRVDAVCSSAIRGCSLRSYPRLVSEDRAAVFS